MDKVLNGGQLKFDFAVFDLDGTLVNLEVDWEKLRTSMGLDYIEQIWTLPEPMKSHAWKRVAEAEQAAVAASPRIESTCKLLDKIKFAVLTNNSEWCAREFLTKQARLDTHGIVVGREWLKDSKRNKKRFSEAIEYILSHVEPSPKMSRSRLAYFGDSKYELEYATEMNLMTFSVNDLGEIEPFYYPQEL